MSKDLLIEFHQVFDEVQIHLFYLSLEIEYLDMCLSSPCIGKLLLFNIALVEKGFLITKIHRQR